VTGYETRHESAYYIDAAFKDAKKISGSAVGRQVAGRLSNNQQVKVGKEVKDDVVVLASGNLGLISFTSVDHRMTLEEISEMFPDLLPGLATHLGIGLVMVRTEQRGPVVLGRNGRIYLTDGEIEGENPLARYDIDAAPILSRADSFSDAPDILVVSTYWKETGEVAAFEELIGSHGGIGGYQTRPFILYPSEYELDGENIQGAEDLHHILKRWTREVIEA